MAELIIFLGLFGVLLIVLLMSKTNNLKKKYNKTTEAFGGVDAYLQQRYDLIPNLIASVKKLMEYESELFTELAKLNTLSKQHDIPIQEKIRINSQIDTRYSQVQFSLTNTLKFLQTSKYRMLCQNGLGWKTTYWLLEEFTIPMSRSITTHMIHFLIR